jgi:hypothetical protein
MQVSATGNKDENITALWKQHDALNPHYTIKPAVQRLPAKFVGKQARCGNCNHLLGTFTKADGEILCNNVNNKVRCKTLNILKK